MNIKQSIPQTSTAVVLARRPVGEPVDQDFRLEQLPLRDLNEGEILIRVLWLSMDPYMRPRMDDRASYAKPVPLGAPMVGQTIGEVVASRSQRYTEGDIVTAYTGWQSYGIEHEDEPRLRKVHSHGLPLSVFLGAAGMPGRTAYFGLLRVGKPKAGETVVVSAASGAVGSVVGQIAKNSGCRVIGVAGGKEKCAYVKNSLGFDDCIDYKSEAFEESLKKACPQGVDVYFENVGGAVAKAVARLLNSGARVPLCGFVATYNEADKNNAESPFDLWSQLPHPPEHRFFLVSEWNDEYQEATDRLATWIREGKIHYRETIAEGLENAVEAFRGMLKGKNLGKQLVRVAE